MKRQFRVNKWSNLKIGLLGLTIAVVGVGVFELYRIIIPFQPGNPLYHEATIGEAVIGAWKYGGYTQDGYLRFYNEWDGQVVMLPPKERLFDADGQFVVIEHSSPTAVTFAEPIDAVPAKWFGIAGIGLFFVTLLIFLKVKLRRGWKTHKSFLAKGKTSAQYHVDQNLQHTGPVTFPIRPRRFRARKSGPRPR